MLQFIATDQLTHCTLHQLHPGPWYKSPRLFAKNSIEQQISRLLEGMMADLYPLLLQEVRWRLRLQRRHYGLLKVSSYFDVCEDWQPGLPLRVLHQRSTSTVDWLERGSW